MEMLKKQLTIFMRLLKKADSRFLTIIIKVKKYIMSSKNQPVNGFFGKFGGAYVPEILYKCVTDLQESYLNILEDETFKSEYHNLLRDYVGRPSPLYHARRMSEKYGCRLFLKREDLNHTGAHKINNTVGQILMAKRMGKTRIIAET